MAPIKGYPPAGAAARTNLSRVGELEQLAELRRFVDDFLEWEKARGAVPLAELRARALELKARAR